MRLGQRLEIGNGGSCEVGSQTAVLPSLYYNGRIDVLSLRMPRLPHRRPRCAHNQVQKETTKKPNQ